MSNWLRSRQSLTIRSLSCPFSLNILVDYLIGYSSAPFESEERLIQPEEKAPDPRSQIVGCQKCTVYVLWWPFFWPFQSKKYPPILLAWSSITGVNLRPPRPRLLGSQDCVPAFSVGSFCVWKLAAVGPSGVHLSTTPATTLIIRLNTTFSILLYIIFILLSTLRPK